MIFLDNFTKAKQLFEDVLNAQFHFIDYMQPPEFSKFHYYFLFTKFYNNNVHETLTISVYFFFLITVCQSGYYGKDCMGRCSVNCYDTSICDRFTGLCTEGCKHGWTGNMCDKRILKESFLSIQAVLKQGGASYLISNHARILGGFGMEIHTQENIKFP